VQQLGWTDDMMLRAETPETPLQIQMLLIYDPSTAPGGKVTFKGILDELDARLHLGPLVGGMNLIHVVASYNGTLSISATADRDAVPDPSRYAECMEQAFQELLSIAD
jgi:hypothetical protein